jgi:16S rRNA (guanine(966)-N(2))-methyltransferase RsmD
MMRIIGGRARGTQLVSFKGSSIRPTLDQVKESFINQVRPSIVGAHFLDLFAGTGNIGVEALSQGAEHVVFVEIDRKAQEIICKNLEKCRFGKPGTSSGPGWELLRTSALQAVQLLDRKGDRFDMVYVDPPFSEGLYEEILLALAGSRILDESSLVVVEHFRRNVLEENYGKLNQVKERRMGDTCLSFFSLE